MNKNLLSLMALFVAQQICTEAPSISIKNIAGTPHHVTLKLNDGTKLEIELARGEETKVGSQISLGDPKKSKSYFVKKITAINKENGQKRSYKLSPKEQKQGLSVTIGETTEEVYVPAPFASEFNSLASADKQVAMVPVIRIS
jgi:hypothetical protein